jgi:hypothetical protein
MNFVEALRNYFRDLAQGDPVALGLTGVFALLLVVAAAIWIIDLLKKKQERDRQRRARERAERQRRGKKPSR